ncbi:hypothetical protein [Lacticaseibacillus brantae]|nr:hypothetical protein [Lacticaseibacillus brantae]
MFLKKVSSFTKFYIRQAMANRITLVFTLLFPVLWTLYQGLSAHRATQMSATHLITATIPFTAYIIVSTALEGVALATMATRDSGFLKSFYFVSGSRWPMLYANMLVQTGLVVLENLVYSAFSMFLYHAFSLQLLLLVVLLTIVTFPLVSLFLTCILLLPVRANSLSALGTSLLIILLMLFDVRTSNALLTGLAQLSPYQFIANTLRLFLGDLTLGTLGVEAVVIAIYCVVGFISYQQLNLQNRGRA